MEEMKHAQLGDPRRKERAACILESWAERPESSIPQATANRSQTNLTYRFLSQKTTSPEAMLGSHTRATLERVAQESEVWIPQDTTSLDYTTCKATQDLGPLENGHRRGFFLHSALVLSTRGTPLGLLSQESWAREASEQGKTKARRKKEIRQKESAKWLRPLDACAQIPSTVRVLLIGDREADIYDLFAHPRPAHVDLLVRAAQNRSVEDEDLLLWDAVGATEVQTVTEIEVERARERPARRARLEVRFRAVEVSVPRHAKERAKKKPVKLWAVLVREIAAPAGEEALEWKLLSTREVASVEQALRMVEAYTQRWKVERFHYVLKSGCQVEALQLGTRERLERALVLYSIVAWRLLWLTYQAREQPSAPCTQALSQAEWQMLYRHAHRGKAAPQEVPTLRAAVLWLGRLGGYMGSTQKSPGVKTLWRGVRRLHDLLEGARLISPDF